MGMVDDLKAQFRTGSMLMRLLYVNVGVFVLIILLELIFFLFAIDGTVTHCGGPVSAVNYYLSVPSSLGELLYRPWTLFTYMFIHDRGGIWHILFNMLVLYLSGRLFLQYLDGKKLLSTYVFGGLCGAAVFILSYNIFPIFWTSTDCSLCLGASASVLAVLMAIATKAPDFAVRLFFLGAIKLKYIALVVVLLDILNIKIDNPGGHLAHLGGALYGFIYIKQLQKGRDFSIGFSRFIGRLQGLFKPKPKLRTVHKRKSRKATSDDQYNTDKAARQRKLDVILDKISKSGYDSLTKEEKEFLFKISNNKK